MNSAIEELKEYKGRGTVSGKTEFIFELLSKILNPVETRSYANSEYFCDSLKHFGKNAPIQGVQGIESSA